MNEPNRNVEGEGEYYEIALNVDRGDGSKLVALLKERDDALYDAKAWRFTAEDTAKEVVRLRKLLRSMPRSFGINDKDIYGSPTTTNEKES